MQRHKMLRSLKLIHAVLISAALAGGVLLYQTFRPSGLPVAEISLGTCEMELEIAEGLEAIGKGLMFRESMPDDHGMFFVLPDGIEPSVWMKNTLIDLDVAFLDRTGRVTMAAPLTAGDLTPVKGPEGTAYLVETNRGVMKRCGFQVGSRLDLPVS